MTSANFVNRRSQQANRFFNLYPGVNARIILPFLLAIIAIAGIGVFIVTQLVAGSIQERFNNQLVDSANSAANTIVDIEREQLATLRLMVFTDGVGAAIVGGDVDDLDTWLRPIAANNRVDEVILFNRDGNALLHLSRLVTVGGVEYETLPPPDVVAWESVVRVVNGLADQLGDKFVDVIYQDDEPVFYISAPVMTENRQVLGGVLVGIRGDTLARRISEQALSSVTFTAPTGDVLGTTFRTSPDALVLDLETSNRLMTEVRTTSPVDELVLDGIPYQVLYTPFQMRSQQIGVLSVGLPSNFIVERSSTSRDIFGLLFAGLFVAVGIVGLLVARTITRPIARLVSTTRAIREGDLTRRVLLNTPDELGELGTSFDDMTDQLVSRNQEINSLYVQQKHETAQRDAVLTSISDAVIVQDMTGHMILRNRTAEDLMDALATDREQRQALTRLIRTPEELSTPQIVTFVEHYFSVLATPVQMQSGELLGHVIVFRDITPIILSEKLKDELVLQMSHELRTPLSAIRGYVDLVQMFEKDKLSAQSIGFIENATDNLTTLERLINQVVDVSGMIANRFTIDIETFNLAYVLNEAVKTWQPYMEKRQLRLSLSLPTNDMWIEGDQRRIEELVDHLLRNSYSYTLPGGMVEVHAEITSQRAIISIVDTGVGIDEDEIEKVFERMYRGRSADAGPTDARGLGLGLYIARHIIEAHSGSIIIESQPNLGTIVTVGLPIKLNVPVTQNDRQSRNMH
jgi:two-component system, OmpR family, sensor histidine kinase VicK